MTELELEYKYMTTMPCQKGKESDLQKACARVLDLNGHAWNHTPNEGKRSPQNGKSLREQGLKKGFPDICIFDLQLVLELKTNYNKPTPDQMEWLMKFRALGWGSFWVNSLDEFLLCYNDFAGRV